MNWNSLDAIVIAALSGAATLILRLGIVALVREPTKQLMNQVWMVKLATNWSPFKNAISSNEWEITWKVESENFPRQNDDRTEVYKFLDFVAAEIVSTTTDKEAIRYGFVGRMKYATLTGRWFDIEDNAGYYGSFQLVFIPTMDKASGKWLGFGRNNEVKSGDLIWKKAGARPIGFFECSLPSA